jgi:hypothetical protein
MLAARQAGYRPNITPTEALMPKAKTSEPAVTTVGISANLVTA